MKTTLFENGWIYTSDRGFRHGSIFTRGEKIAAVLFDDEDPTNPGANKLDVVDLKDGYILPGFVDTHLHLTSIALKSARCDLSAAESADDVGSLLADWAEAHDTSHVMGVEWDETFWSDPTLPTRSMLDGIDSTRPVLARRICGHVGVANTPMLAKLAEHSDLIDSDTGFLREHALWEAGRLCEPDLRVLHDGMEAAIRSLHKLGITAIHDIVEPAKFESYVAGFKNSQAPLRIDMLLHTHPDELPGFTEKVIDSDSEYLRVSGVKCFLDGSFGGRSAALNAPYEGSGDETGMLLLSDEELASIVRASLARECSCAIHAIGDRAIDQALSALRDVPGDAENFRIEHCELIGPDQLNRLKDSPVFLAMQPNFVRKWGSRAGTYGQLLGEERARYCNPWRSLADAGVSFVFGSDGMPPGPLFGLSGATQHPVEEQRLGAEEAITRYCVEPNWVGLHKRAAGVNDRDMLADMVVLSDDPLGGRFDDIAVQKTVVGGEVVYDAATG